MTWKPLLLVLLAIGEGICFYDPTAPDPSELNDDRPTLVIKLQGFTPNVRVAIRYWGDTTPYAFPNSFTMYTDAQGRFLGSISLPNTDTAISYILLVDENGNNTWDGGDYGVYRSSLSFASGILIEDNLTYAAATMSSYTTVQAAPGTGILRCIYMPNDKNAWTTADAQSIVEFPEMRGVSLSLSDWISISTKDSLTATTTAYLPAGTYKETCVTDANSNDVWDSTETSVNTGNVTFP